MDEFGRDILTAPDAPLPINPPGDEIVRGRQRMETFGASAATGVVGQMVSRDGVLYLKSPAGEAGKRTKDEAAAITVTALNGEDVVAEMVTSAHAPACDIKAHVAKETNTTADRVRLFHKDGEEEIVEGGYAW